jgi:F-type H+-transporting ATPase subunit alpha
MHSQHSDVREKIAGGDWSEGTQAAVKDAVATFAEDFGYDLDEEGQPLDDDGPPPRLSSNGSEDSSDGDAAERESDREEQPQPA